ncbi:MAG: cold shock domain-containing protein [Clostridiales bacterium]|nr:cold shock domain-containing protein [Clostridiales bacterium]
MKTKKGIIVTIQALRGFGFIRGEDEQKIFFHASGVINPEFEELKEGNRVEYLEEDSKKGKRAIGIVVIAENKTN